jgi:hypothetical protein
MFAKNQGGYNLLSLIQDPMYLIIFKHFALFN